MGMGSVSGTPVDAFKSPALHLIITVFTIIPIMVYSFEVLDILTHSCSIVKLDALLYACSTN